MESGKTQLIHAHADFGVCMRGGGEARYLTGVLELGPLAAFSSWHSAFPPKNREREREQEEEEEGPVHQYVVRVAVVVKTKW